jgi:NAD-dependent deacetylase
MKRVVVFSGSGISAESGIKTFRDSGGLWEEYRIEEVATPEAWERDPALVLDFYNKRRAQILQATPNPAHIALTRLESKFDVQIITQNIDDLHERAGSTKVLHVHGEIRKARSTADPYWIVPIEGADLCMGDVCPRRAQLRPHIVWFGEAVPAMEEAILLAAYADIFIVTGTSLEVYPAASLLHYVPAHVEKYIVDPAVDSARVDKSFTVIRKKAGEGIPELVEKLLNQNVE